MSPDERARLQHILEAVERIQKYTRSGKSAFKKSDLIQDGVIRNLEILGEASRGLSDDFRTKHKHLPWGKLIGLRNVLAHEYFGVDLEIVWGIVKRRLPGVRRDVSAILKKLDSTLDAQ